MGTEFQITDEIVVEFLKKNFSGDLLQKWALADWEQFKASKQPKPEWEVVELKDTHYNRMVTNANKLPIYRLEDYLTHYTDGRFVIYSVKRLSDGEVFTIGDVMQMDDRTNSIFGFEISGPWMMLKYNATDSWNISYVKKIKAVLFITEDGVPYYAGEKKDIYCLHTKEGYNSVGAWHIDVHPEYYEGLKPHYEYFFSTKEKAEEYKLFNAPLLSLEEIKRHGGNINYNNPYFKTLIQKAKDKLNPTT